MAQIWLALARMPLRYHWLSYATGTYHITRTTLVLVLLALGDPVAATHSIVVWCFYLIAIAITALRNDGRLTLYVTALALAQYALLVGAVFWLAPSGEMLVSIDYGTAAAATQVERLILILMMGLLTSAIVYRMPRLVEMSGNDGLTGLPHRAWLLQGMPRMFETIPVHRGSLTLALLDLHPFNPLNERQ